MRFATSNIAFSVFLRTFSCTLLLLSAISICSAVDRPHIVLIMADDMGFSDLGCYGSEIETPNIDALADEGVRFSRFNNTGRCCPSRASLLTGRYQHAVGMGWMTAVDEHRPGYRGQVSADVPTIAEILKGHGYANYMSGKWHLTVEGGWLPLGVKPNGSWPTQRGFDEFYGGMTGGGGYYKVKGLKRNETAITSFPNDFYYTRAITQHAVEFVENHDPDQPMFLYLPHYAPHVPLQAPKDRVEMCRQRYEAGYDVLRQQRFERLEKMGLIPAGQKLPSNAGEFDDEVRPAWDDLSAEKKELWITEMATYAAMIEIMDDGVGDVMEALKKKGMLDNTVVLFLSDNGASARQSKVARLRADLCNTPYRYYKCFTYTGGTSSPLIVKAPKFSALAGEIRKTRSHINDVLPTCLDFAGVDYPRTFHDNVLDRPDGVSLLDVIRNDSIEERDLFFEHQTSCAVISGDYKLVRFSSQTPWQLYHLKDDPFETEDVAQQLPEKALELESRWTAWAQENNVLPLEEREWKVRIAHYQSMNSDQRGQSQNASDGFPGDSEADDGAGRRPIHVGP